MGFLDGVKNFFGTQPGEIQPGAVNPTSGSGGFLGGLQQAPVQGPSTTFMDRMNKPNDRGMNFFDKLYAAGSIAQGQDPGQFMQGRQLMATNQRNKDDAKLRQSQLGKVLASSYNPDGSINPQTYASGAANIGEGLDLESALKLQQANQDQWSPMSAGSDVVMGNKRTGQFGSTYKGTPKLGKYLKQDPITGETVIDYDAIKAESLAAGGKAKAQFPFRRPPAPHPGLNSYTPPNAQPLPP